MNETKNIFEILHLAETRLHAGETQLHAGETRNHKCRVFCCRLQFMSLNVFHTLESIKTNGTRMCKSASSLFYQ